MQTAADFLKPVVEAALPGVTFYHGTLKHLDAALKNLPVLGQCVCLNDSIHFNVSTTKTGAQEVGQTISLVIGIKSHPAWDAAQRNLVQRVTLGYARALGPAFEAAGATIKAALQGDTFFNLFSVNVDGCQVAYQLELPDTWDYCLPDLGSLPPLPEEELPEEEPEEELPEEEEPEEELPEEPVEEGEG